jgi:prepilin-type N-terminal cleavage/methylation domain-containing protein
MSSTRNHIERRRNSRGFSLIELVIVVVIIAIIGAIAVPRMSRGAQGASDSALNANLKVLRSAIDLYATEHNGTYPSVASFQDLLTKFSSDDGSKTADAKDAANGVIYGPYLRTVPSLPVGTKKGTSTVVDGSSGSVTGTGGWFYNPSTGSIVANLPADNDNKDAAGKYYNAY